MPNSKYLHQVNKKILVFDGAMGTSIQNLNLTAKHYGGEKYHGCHDYLTISHPQAIQTVHTSFLEAGADVIETNTFRSNRITLKEYDLDNQTKEINQNAAGLARKIADQFSTQNKPRFVAGSIGPSGKLPSMDDPELSNITFDQLADVFREQASGLLLGGVDLLLIETSQDILEVKAAVLGLQEAMKDSNIWVPIQAQVTLDTTGKMLLGTDISGVLATLIGLPISVIGLNCSTGPEHMRDSIRYLCENSPLPVSCVPNAGLPLNVDGEAVYPMKPQPFADELSSFVDQYGLNIIGGCCGTTPEHIKFLAEQIEKPNKKFFHNTLPPQLSSSIQATSMIQEPPPFLIGERLNTQGSRKFKRLLLEEDFDSIITIANTQIENGAHGLDLCVALTEQPDEAALMKRVIKTLSPITSVPFIIDTTEPDVMETALQTAPGRCLINSTHLESGPEKANIIFSLAKKYNAAIIVLTIDEQGMAKTVERKLEIARRIYDIAINEHHLQPQDLVFDTLTFTLATGDDEFNKSAIETLNSIEVIKSELPGVLTSLGVSNVSFGLSPNARAVLNSVMLYHATQKGLDMAIVNPIHITPYTEIPETEKKLAEDLIFFKREDALQKLIAHFENTKSTSQEKVNKSEALLKTMSAEERLHWKIVHRYKEELEKDIDEILDRQQENISDNAVNILNTVLLPAMKEVGDKFGNGELILPFVLQSAEAMKKAVAHLEQYLERKEGVSKGKMVLATVYGDVHDIGKNLVKTILSNNGYSVVDLGKQVPAETIISKAIEEKADAIGLSALLVSTSKQMPLIVNELQRRNISIPVLIGGAAINKRFGRRILLTDEENFYEAGVFYCKDAFEGLSTMDALTETQSRKKLLEETRKDAEKELGRPLSSSTQKAHHEKSAIQPAEKIPSPPHWGARVVSQMPLDAVFKCLSKNELFRLSWGAKNTRGDEWTQLEKEFEERLENMRREALQSPWLFPQGIYGYWPAQSEDTDIIIYDPDSTNSGTPREITRFNFPRQNSGEYLCIADYFSPVSSGIMDVVAFHIVTVGHEATERFETLQEAGNYSEAYFTHGLAVQMAEASAEYIHRHIRNELGLPQEQGKRYSWGYPSIPELTDHTKVFQLLPAESKLNMSLTSAYQLIPEQSTAAIILHHPLAKYFTIGESRIEQLMKS